MAGQDDWRETEFPFSDPRIEKSIDAQSAPQPPLQQIAPETTPNSVAESGPKKENTWGPYTKDLLWALISALFAQGYAMSGMPSSIEGACICWFIASCFGFHVIWIGLRNNKKSVWLRLCVVLCLFAIICLLGRGPIIAQYHRQHLIPSAITFALLPDKVRLGDGNNPIQTHILIRNPSDIPASGVELQFSIHGAGVSAVLVHREILV